MRQIKFRTWNGKQMESFVFDTDFDCISGWLDGSVLMQFNPKRNVYEGDIVKRNEKDCDGKNFEAIYKVMFNGDKFYLMVIESKIYRPDSVIYVWGDLHVIGNIHEHPHLLSNQAKG